MIKLSEIRGAFHFSRRERTGLLGVMLMLFILQWVKEYKKSWYQDPLPKDQVNQLFSFLELYPVIQPPRRSNFQEPKESSYDRSASTKVQNHTSSERIFLEKEKWEGSEEVQPPLNIELNQADSAMLTSIRGVGGWSAKRILRFRDALGGFHDLAQLDEVYGLREEVLQALLPSIHLDTVSLQKIQIDTCSVETLAGHPYISWKLAKTLVAYREQHGGYNKVEDVTKCVLMNDSIFARIKPYLDVTN